MDTCTNKLPQGIIINQKLVDEGLAVPDTPTTNQVNDTARTAFPESSNVTAVALATPPGKDKGKCFSFFDILSKEPSTVSLADLGLFEADVIDLIVSFGFDLSQLAHVLSLPEAGRTKECLSSWKLVTNSKWVLNIIESGVTWHWKRGPPSQILAGGGGVETFF